MTDSRFIETLDSTLRDGAQGAGVSFSADDKLKIVTALDNFGISFIEAGNPGSNPKDAEFFDRVKMLSLKQSKLCAFGSTKRAGTNPRKDPALAALIDADTEYISVFGKSWDFHASEILGVSLEENLRMIAESVEYLSDKGKKILFDAEHFFDGCKHNRDYALAALKTAAKAGAFRLVLCDTNGGCFPDEILTITRDVTESLPKSAQSTLAIHCHNDTGCAVASSIAAIKAGCVQVQGTFGGIGERTGNANLATIIGNLSLKLGYDCRCKLANLTELSNFIAELSNNALPGNSPYVGRSAFAHKGGMHADGVIKSPKSFEHVEPELIGNSRTFPMSEVSGRTALIEKIRRYAPDVARQSEEASRLIEKLKVLESEGWQFEAADASFQLMTLKELGRFTPYFTVDYYKIISAEPSSSECAATAAVKVSCNGKTEVNAAEGNGPVNALDRALRKTLEIFYPELKHMRLTDYKVRVSDSRDTAATTRVLIESTDGRTSWTTTGASGDIIAASMLALTDSIEYFIATRS